MQHCQPFLLTVLLHILKQQYLAEALHDAGILRRITPFIRRFLRCFTLHLRRVAILNACMMQLHAVLHSCKNPKPACFLVSQRTLKRQCLAKTAFLACCGHWPKKAKTMLHAGLTSV